MSKEELIKRLYVLGESAKGWAERPKHDGESPEGAHIKADEALLEYIGDKEVVKAFNSINKWYA